MTATFLPAPPRPDRVQVVMKPRTPPPPRVHPDYEALLEEPRVHPGYRALLTEPLDLADPQPVRAGVAVLAALVGLLAAALLVAAFLIT